MDYTVKQARYAIRWFIGLSVGRWEDIIGDINNLETLDVIVDAWREAGRP
jgi:hypothetical protein